MGDREMSVLDEAVDRLLDALLSLDVHLRRGLVEDQDRRVVQGRPGDRQPPALAGGEALAELADQALVPIGLLDDESCALAIFAARTISLRVAPGFAYRCSSRSCPEQERVLARCRSAGAGPRCGSRGSARRRRAPRPRWVVEAADQVDRGGLPCAALPDQADHLPRLDLDDTPLTPVGAVVAEGDIAELELPRIRASDRVEPPRPPARVQHLEARSAAVSEREAQLSSIDMKRSGR